MGGPRAHVPVTPRQRAMRQRICFPGDGCGTHAQWAPGGGLGAHALF
jgi:hypothetical protein